MTKTIEQVVGENPELLPFGWMTEGMDGLGDAGGASMLTPDFRDQVDRAMRFIQEHAVPRRGPNRREGSYGLKHQAEGWAGGYVSNGAFIVAALMLGYEARRFPGSPNCAFNMDVNAPAALRRRA